MTGSIRQPQPTSREASGDPATLFTGERSTTLSLTDIEVSIPPRREIGTVQWPPRLPPDLRTDLAVLHALPLTRDDATV